MPDRQQPLNSQQPAGVTWLLLLLLLLLLLPPHFT
jgi:hypothetical protein